MNVPRFSPKNQIHAEIAKLSRMCHDATVSDSLNSLKELEAKLDEACGHMWGIDRSEVKSIIDCLVQIRGVKRQGKADRTKKP